MRRALGPCAVVMALSLGCGGAEKPPRAAPLQHNESAPDAAPENEAEDEALVPPPIDSHPSTTKAPAPQRQEPEPGDG